MIAPTFESLATKYAKPNRIAFCKVDVDNQTEVAKQYGVSAMPTFLVLRNGSVIETIRGANPPALTAAVEKAVKLAGPGAGSGATFSGAGQRLGGIGVGRTAAGAASRPSALARFDLRAFLNGVVAFFGMYFWTLFSVSVGLLVSSAATLRTSYPRLCESAVLTCYYSSTLTRLPRARRSLEATTR